MSLCGQFAAQPSHPYYLEVARLYVRVWAVIQAAYPGIGQQLKDSRLITCQKKNGPAHRTISDEQDHEEKFVLEERVSRVAPLCR
jgi:hypothetical protein